MDTAMVWLSGIINLIIPAIIFLYLNDVIFLSKNTDKSAVGKKSRRHKMMKLLLLSPIGLFVALIAMVITIDLVANSFLVATGVIEFTGESTIVPRLSSSRGFFLESDTIGSYDIGTIVVLAISLALAVPLLMLFMRKYCKAVNCSWGLGVFVYMAVLFMYVTSTIVSMPINDVNPSASGLISSASFIAMLLIFYIPSRDKIELMRQNENSNILKQINTLPIINFVLLLILLAFEIMIIQSGYMDALYYTVILIFAVILYAESQFAYSILFKHVEELGRIEELSYESLASQEQVTLAFAEITEAKSGQTGQHIKRVSEYSKVIAQAMGLPQKEVENIRIASMMHDVGKLLIPPEILEKMGRLTEDEFETMKTHVTIGENLLHNAPGEIMSVARVIAQQHHEWYNGNGYLGMRGDEIELPARITAVADVYDALTSNRSYKKAWYSDQAHEMILNESGEHFDPEVVKAFDEHFDEILEIQERYRDELNAPVKGIRR